MRSTFKDPQLQTLFEREGYVKVPFLNRPEVEELTEIYHKINPGTVTGFQPSIGSDNVAYKIKADQTIKRVLQRAVERYFDDYRPILGNFIIKAPDENSEVGIHEDWTLVDERQYAAATIWCPLIDTDEENGTLSVLPGSHRFVETLRGSPPRYESAYKGLDETIKKYSISYPVIAGEALIMHTNSVHFSPPNHSQSLRLVAGLGAIPQEAQLLHYYFHQDGRIEAFEVADTFLRSLTLGERPKGEGAKSLGFIDFGFKQLSKEELESYFVEEPKGWFQRLFKLLRPPYRKSRKALSLNPTI